MAGIFPNGGVSPIQALPSNLPEIETVGTNCVTRYNNNRCNSRVDAASVNTIIAEIGNLVNCAGLPYDCSKFTNVCEAVTKISESTLFGCLPESFPNAINFCDVQYLVQTTDAEGCRRISTYSPEENFLARVYDRSVWGLTYTQKAHPLANQQTVGTHIYNFYTLGTDVLNDNVNTTLLYGPGNQNWLAEMNFALNCDSIVDIDYLQIMSFEPSRNSGNGSVSTVVMMVDGVIPMLPSRAPHNFGFMTNFVKTYESSARLGLAPGNHNIKFFLTSESASPARVEVVGLPDASCVHFTARVAPR